MTSEAANRSVDCLVSDDSATPRSVISTAIDLFIPLTVVLVYVFFWAIVTFSKKESMFYLLKRCVLSAVAVLYVSYISMTKTLVNVLNCVDVHDSLDVATDKTTSHWAMDTTVICYQDSHAALAGAVSWPLLFFFSVGFPVTASSVITKKVGEDFKKGWIYETAGFMYRAYKPNLVFWESVIMLRKAILAVVVVFAYPLGGNLQGILGTFVLILASYFQALCRPYRVEFDVLNEIESLSLMVSLITFVSGSMFNDDRVHSVVRAMVTASVLLCNLALFIFFAGLLLVLAADHLRYVLDREEVEYNPSSSSVRIVWIYCRHLFIAFAKGIRRTFGRRQESFATARSASSA